MKILFCSDGSREAEKAVRFGAPIAAACQADPSILGIAEKAEAEEVLLKSLRRVQDIFKKNNVEAKVITRVGRPVREIVKCTEENHYDLVVIGAMNKKDFRRLFDPVVMSVQAYTIIESVEPPVLVVSGGNPPLRRILLCTGGAEYIDKAIGLTGKIAQCANAVVDLVHVMPEVPAMYADLVQFEEDVDRVLESNSKLGLALRHQKDLLEKLGVFGEVRLRQGEVVPELLKEMQRTPYDLVVSGSMPAEETLRKYVMGDVAREILERVDLPVLIIRTGQKLHFVNFFRDLLGRLFRSTTRSSEALNS